jgi:N utilization substance protein A
MKGMRVQSIIRELRGEKIDIIEFSDDPVVFATHALSPAKISRVTILDAGEKHMEVIVDDSQLSLAIGKKGQNVRLAAKLLGWKIDIKSEEEKRQEVETAMAALVVPGAPVSVLIDYGLGEGVAEKLVEAGVSTVEKLGSMTPEQLEEIPGIEQNVVEKIQLAVNNYYGQFDTEEGVSAQPAAGEAEAAEEVEAGLETAPETDLTQTEAEPGLEEQPPPEQAPVAEEMAETVIEAPETEPNIESAAGESDTIKDSRQGDQGGSSEGRSEEGKEG